MSSRVVAKVIITKGLRPRQRDARCGLKNSLTRSALAKATLSVLAVVLHPA